MKGKRKRPGRKRPSQLVKGVPGGDCDSCSAWLLKNIRNKPKGCRAKVGEIARTQFEILLDDCIRELLDLALPLREKDPTTKEWTGRILAKLHVTLEAHKWKLAGENPAYSDWKAKWKKTRADVLIPQSKISQMVREELINAEIYQSQLWYLRESIERQPDLHLETVNKKAVFERIRDEFVLPHFAGVSRTKLKGEALERRYGALWTKQGLAAIEKAARKATPSFLYLDEILQSVSCTWQDLAQQEGIPKVYWSTIDLPRFGAASADKWWDWLWPRILEDQKVLLPGRDPSKVYKQIRGYLLALVGARENGTF